MKGTKRVFIPVVMYGGKFAWRGMEKGYEIKSIIPERIVAVVVHCWNNIACRLFGHGYDTSDGSGHCADCCRVVYQK